TGKHLVQRPVDYTQVFGSIPAGQSPGVVARVGGHDDRTGAVGEVGEVLDRARAGPGGAVQPEQERRALASLDALGDVVRAVTSGAGEAERLRRAALLRVDNGVEAAVRSGLEVRGRFRPE